MSDKMMRIAGRGSDGKARAIQTNSNGKIGVHNIKSTHTFDWNRATVIPEGGSIDNRPLLNVTSECLIQSMTLIFPHAGGASYPFFSLIFDDGQQYRTTSPNNNPSAQISPSRVKFDGLFEYLGAEGEQHYVVLKRPILVKGFSLTCSGTSGTPIGVQVTWSEV